MNVFLGLDNVILPYINSFLNNEVKGHQLLNLRSDDLEHLGVHTLGHQELILEAVEHLRNFVSILIFLFVLILIACLLFFSTMSWIEKIYNFWHYDYHVPLNRFIGNLYLSQIQVKWKRKQCLMFQI